MDQEARNKFQIINAQENPLDYVEVDNEFLDSIKPYQIDSREKPGLENLTNDSFNYLVEKIWQAVEQEFPQVVSTLIPPKLPKLLLFSKKSFGEPAYKGFLGGYSPLYHTEIINADAEELNIHIAVVHETFHSLCRNLSVVDISQDESSNLNYHNSANISGIEVESDKHLSGNALNEGLIEYFTTQFITYSPNPSAEKVRELVKGYLFDLKPYLDQHADLSSEIEAYLSFVYAPGSEMYEAVELIKELLTDNKIKTLLLSSLINPSAKNRLASVLRKKYGFVIARDLFRIKMSKDPADQQNLNSDSIRRLRYAIKKIDYDKEIELSESQVTLPTKQNIFDHLLTRVRQRLGF